MSRLHFPLASLWLLVFASPPVLASDCHPTPDCSEARIRQLGQAMRVALSNEKTAVASAILHQIADCAWQRRQAQVQASPSER
ncbi:MULTISPECIES: hypothetical protein [unclassified Paludibacterium]|uniref:hypothetical protein n=1 Tax=unclassified Paludibacterium TaxID=2618429 RepID=UPI001C04503F|nr:hypothetical protein [Paludibacterium sp. B53371]BEV71385.1 hypothetical protein THUN1379_08670 [Paludibacterium sp. THUN1379]